MTWAWHGSMAVISCRLGWWGKEYHTDQPTLMYRSTLSWCHYSLLWLVCFSCNDWPIMLKLWKQNVKCYGAVSVESYSPDPSSPLGTLTRRVWKPNYNSVKIDGAEEDASLDTTAGGLLCQVTVCVTIRGNWGTWLPTVLSQSLV